MAQLSDLETLDGYRRLFTDLALWAPHARAACRRHGLEPAREVRATLPGTCPVFIVEERWVVKFFGRLFAGGQAFAVEREANRLAAPLAAPRAGQVPCARLLAEGALGGAGWPWPYLIFARVPGEPFGAQRERIPLADRLRAARALGRSLRRLHNLPLAGSPVFPDAHQPFLRFLRDQREGLTARLRGWGSLPERLIAQVDAFLPPLETLAEMDRRPHLIHADLTGDHLLGGWLNGRWASRALIDFGDAMTGSLEYELAALQLDLFAGEGRLLAAFLQGYRLPAARRAGLARRALAAALLHRFDVFAAQGEALADAASLDDLANRLWPAAVNG